MWNHGKELSMSLAHWVPRLTGTRPAVQTVPPAHRRVAAAGLAAAAITYAALTDLAPVRAGPK
jgi:hypothetical protein